MDAEVVAFSSCFASTFSEPDRNWPRAMFRVPPEMKAPGYCRNRAEPKRFSKVKLLKTSPLVSTALPVPGTHSPPSRPANRSS